MSNSIIILTNQEEMTYTGDRHKGDGYYGYSDGLHTVSFHVSNFIGRIYLQATLVEQPAETDWFDIELKLTTPYIEFATQTTTTEGATFTGNFVWLRAKIDRNHLVAVVYDPLVHGRLEKIVLAI